MDTRFSEHLMKTIEQSMAAAFERSTALCVNEMNRVFDYYNRTSEARRRANGGCYSETGQSFTDSLEGYELTSPYVPSTVARSIHRRNATKEGASGYVTAAAAADGGGECLVGTQKDGSLRTKVESPNTDGDKKDVRAAEGKVSIPKSDGPADVLDEGQNCSDKAYVAMLDQNDQTAGASHIGSESVHESSCGSRKGDTKGNDECAKTEVELETQKAQSDVFSSSPIQLADGGDATVINKYESLSFDVKDDANGNVQNKAGMSCSNEKEIVESDHPFIATTVGAETGDQNVGFGEKGMETEISEKSIGSHVADVMETDTIQASIVQEGIGNGDLLVSPTDTSLVDGSVNRAKDLPKESNGFCVVGVYGPEASGKTTLALHMIA